MYSYNAFNTYQCGSTIEHGKAGSKGTKNMMPGYLENSMAKPQDNQFRFIASLI